MDESKASSIPKYAILMNEILDFFVPYPTSPELIPVSPLGEEDVAFLEPQSLKFLFVG